MRGTRADRAGRTQTEEAAGGGLGEEEMGQPLRDLGFFLFNSSFHHALATRPQRVLDLSTQTLVRLKEC